eukprot:TRINITY_DN3246_c0_g1_i1.p1 TRINITY_DN3246_c0_g1~~TRINITY_DN3246_c0_g1_i1.p1  ORF type:complete len:172 (-),score=23.28 TRINITY_DN3246_c0_g1_i1:188-703(-)
MESSWQLPLSVGNVHTDNISQVKSLPSISSSSLNIVTTGIDGALKLTFISLSQSFSVSSIGSDRHYSIELHKISSPLLALSTILHSSKQLCVCLVGGTSKVITAVLLHRSPTSGPFEWTVIDKISFNHGKSTYAISGVTIFEEEKGSTQSTQPQSQQTKMSKRQKKKKKKK